MELISVCKPPPAAVRGEPTPRGANFTSPIVLFSFSHESRKSFSQPACFHYKQLGHGNHSVCVLTVGCNNLFQPDRTCVPCQKSLIQPGNDLLTSALKNLRILAHKFLLLFIMDSPSIITRRYSCGHTCSAPMSAGYGRLTRRGIFAMQFEATSNCFN